MARIYDIAAAREDYPLPSCVMCGKRVEDWQATCSTKCWDEFKAATAFVSEPTKLSDPLLVEALDCAPFESGERLEATHDVLIYCLANGRCKRAQDHGGECDP